MKAKARQTFLFLLNRSRRTMTMNLIYDKHLYFYYLLLNGCLRICVYIHIVYECPLHNFLLLLSSFPSVSSSDGDQFFLIIWIRCAETCSKLDGTPPHNLNKDFCAARVQQLNTFSKWRSCVHIIPVYIANQSKDNVSKLITDFLSKFVSLSSVYS